MMPLNNNYDTIDHQNIKNFENEIVAFKMNESFPFKGSFNNPEEVQLATILVDDLFEPSNIFYVNYFNSPSQWGYPLFNLNVNDFGNYFSLFRKATPYEGYRIYKAICLGNIGHNNPEALEKVKKIAQHYLVNLLFVFGKCDQCSLIKQLPLEILSLIINLNLR